MKERLVSDELHYVDILIKKTIFKYSKDMSFKSFPSPLQERIMIYLDDNKDNIVYQKDLEKELNVSKVTISEVLNKMEKNGIIFRETSKIDGRNKSIKCNYGNFDKFENLRECLKEIDENLLKDISDEELKVFNEVLNKMKKNLKENLEGNKI